MRKLVILLLISFILSDAIYENLKEGRLPLFVGIGYDLPLGNPLADKVDPGFRAGIFQFTYYQNQTTEDTKYIIPDGIAARLRHSCSYSAKTDEFTGVREYQNELRGKVSIGGGYDDSLTTSASFSASFEFSSLTETTKRERNVYISSGATCEIYDVFLPKFQGLPLSADFKEGVMLAFKDNSVWKSIIEYFGTHYVVTAILGGRMSITQKIKESSYQELKSMGIDVQVAAKMKYAQYSGDLSTEWKSHTNEINSLSSRTDELKEVYVGGKPPKSGDWKDWQEIVADHPAPIIYGLASISELFTSKNFNELNQEQLTEMKRQFKVAVDNYCKSKNCFIPGPDRPFPPKAKSQLYVTREFGGSGGSRYFDEPSANPVLSARKVLVTVKDGLIVNIQLYISDGNTSFYTPIRGGSSDEIVQTWNVPENEDIAQIEVRASKYVDSLTFITNKGTKSPKFGGNGGDYYMVKLTGRLVGFYGKCGSLVDSIGFVTSTIIYNTSAENKGFLKELI